MWRGRSIAEMGPICVGVATTKCNALRGVGEMNLVERKGLVARSAQDRFLASEIGSTTGRNLQFSPRIQNHATSCKEPRSKEDSYCCRLHQHNPVASYCGISGRQAERYRWHLRWDCHTWNWSTDFVTEVLVLGLYPGLYNVQAFEGVFQVPVSNLGLEASCHDREFRLNFRTNSEVWMKSLSNNSLTVDVSFQFSPLQTAFNAASVHVEKKRVWIITALKQFVHLRYLNEHDSRKVQQVGGDWLLNWAFLLIHVTLGSPPRRSGLANTWRTSPETRDLDLTKSNETSTWCNTVQVLFLLSHSTCFERNDNTCTSGRCTSFKYSWWWALAPETCRVTLQK